MEEDEEVHIKLASPDMKPLVWSLKWPHYLALAFEGE